MKIRAGASRDAMRRPGRRIIRVVGEMVTGVDVEVLGGHDVLVAGFAGQIVVDGAGQRGPPETASEPPSQKSFLHVDDDQRSHAVHPIAVGQALRSCGDAPSGLFADPPGNPAAMLIRRIARPLLSAVFIGQGVESLLNPKPAAEAAAPAVDGLQALPDPVGSNIPERPRDVSTNHRGRSDRRRFVAGRRRSCLASPRPRWR